MVVVFVVMLLLLLLLLFLLFMSLLLLIPETYLQSLVKIGEVTAEILLTLSLRWVSGDGGVQSHFHVKRNFRLS